MSAITLILPSYNVCRYIENCINSIQQQTFSDFEILCIDAGSTDGTLEIIKHHAALDNRIHIIISDKKSYGYQVNMGMRMAHGKYLSVVDTDDSIEPNALKHLYEIAEKYECDTARGNYETVILTDREYLVRKDNVLKNCGLQNKYGAVLRMRDYPKLPTSDQYMWAGIYRTDFIRTYQIYLNETPGAATQDAGFMLKYLCVSKRAVYIPEITYHYTISREESSMKNRKLLIYFQWEIQRLFKENNVPEIEFNATRRVLNRRIFLSVNAITRLLYRSVNKSDEESYILEALRWFHDLAASENQKGFLVLDDFPTEEQEDIRNMVSNLNEYALSVKNAVNKLKEKEMKFNNIIKGFLEKGKLFILFGLGQRGRDFYFKHMDMKFSAITDNNKALWNTRWDANDLEIIPPQKAVECFPEAIFLIANKKFADDIFLQLCGYGIPQNHIIICVK